MSTPREIAFDDIRKGDDIEVQWQLKDALETRRGIAHHKAVTDWWLTERGVALVTPHDDGTIYRHPRPAPAEPESLGAVVRTDEGDEYVSVNREPGTPRWVYVEARESGTRWAVEWLDLDPDSIEVLREGKEVES